MRYTDLKGQRFNFVEALEYIGNSRWKCLCVCGKECVSTYRALVNGERKSCGCKRNQLISESKTRHGMAATSTYRCWQKMLERCRLKTSRIYSYYGGRGITVCERWLKFDNFLADMGERPTERHQIDRKDPNGNYEPGNTQWNLPGAGLKRNSVLFNGRPLKELSIEMGIPYMTLYCRLKNNGTIYRSNQHERSRQNEPPPADTGR